MFWRFGGYANISTIDTILEKPDFSLEDLLDESDLIQELKQHNAKLIDFLRQDIILAKLLEYAVAPRLENTAAPSESGNAEEQDGQQQGEDAKGKGLLRPFSRPRASSRVSDTDADEEQEKKRNRYAFVAAEVLSSDTWSIYEAMMENQDLIREFWTFLKRDTPLDPLQASYFTKVNEALFDKKTEEMVILLKALPDAVPDLLRHVECPMVMDLLLKIIALDRTEGGHGIVEWLYSQDVIPTLLACLSPENNWVVQTAAGDFIKAIITISANASQNDQQCIGPNELTRQLVSQPCVEQLIKYMLCGANPLTVGVGIVIEVIRKNNSDYDPDVGTEANSVPSSRDPIYLGTLLRLFAEHVPDFVNLIMEAPAQKRRNESTFGNKIEPLGFDRFKTCELMAELLHCSNMGLLNEVGSEDLIASRDAERHRLRAEGRLSPNRGEDLSSMEDITMRVGQSSPEEGRKLEVTNVSDDDGFEEVEPSREMSEDTSHEFVKAEEEIPAGPPPSSFLDKDDDDFVDEPLSSPRLNTASVDDQTYDEPELMVAPLSPTKPKPTEDADQAGDTTVQPTEEAKPAESTEISGESQALAQDSAEQTTIQVRQLNLEDKHAESSEKETVSTSGESDSTTVEYTPSGSETEAKPESNSETAATASDEQAGGRVSGGPDPIEGAATPAPLFSKPSATTTPDTTDATPQPEAQTGVDSSTEAAVDTQNAGKEDGNAADDATNVPAPAEADETQTEEHPADAPVIPERPAPSNMPPVVGDFLKMQFVEYRVVPTILDFFFSYPWNNFLHNVVYDIVQQVFNGPMDRGFNPTLAVSLFEAADITNAIINGQLASDESQAKHKTRMGYMGHLTLIAEEVVKFTERHPPELLSETVLDRVMDQNWINYVEGSLAETRERDNAILGGVRPEVAMSNRAGMSGNGLPSAGLSGLGSSFGNNNQGSGSNALAEAGLNGGMDSQDNSGNGIGPFAISAGALMSGFGSSSDEDDDDAEDNDEDANNEFRAYTDPQNQNSSTSMDPPSIPPPPPPPPPLNIPPSRARLQLAARLAMHQKSGNGDSQGDAVDGDRQAANDDADQLRNPFEDDDDVDIDSDDEEDDGRQGNARGSWSSAGRGSWWRGVVRRRQNERFEGKDDSDSDREDNGEDDDDEEFGDFAMPEAEPAPGTDPNEKVLLKPLAVHPSESGSGAQNKAGLSGLWPFSAKEGKEEEGSATGEEKEEASATSNDGPTGPAGGPTPAAEVSEKPEAGEGTSKVQEAVEAKRRTSIEEPDDEEVVVQKPTET